MSEFALSFPEVRAASDAYDRLAQLEALARDLAACNGIHPDEYSVQTLKLVRRALELTGGAR